MRTDGEHPGNRPHHDCTVLAYLGDMRRFDSAKSLAAFIGVTPIQAILELGARAVDDKQGWSRRLAAGTVHAGIVALASQPGNQDLRRKTERQRPNFGNKMVDC